MNIVACGIRSIIKSKGLVQRAVAKRAGFSAQQFTDMLNGRKTIRAEYLPQIAEALGVRIEELFETGNLGA